VARSDPFDRPREGSRGFESELAVYQDRARRLGLSFVPFFDLGQSPAATAAAIRRGTFALSPSGRRMAYLAPDESAMPAIRQWLAHHPAARTRLRISTPGAVRAALLARSGDRLAAAAVNCLRARHRRMSARRVFSFGQIAAGMGLLAGLAAAWISAPAFTLVAVNFVTALLFFGVTALRFVAASYAGRRRKPTDAGPRPIPDEALPIYSVLVPLRDEAAIVEELVSALGQLDWPRDRLDVKILLEADDRATIAAARRAAHEPWCELVVVPPVGPRTKPKALAFALPLCRGEFITVYDAEDRPHPQQLREAFVRFRRCPPDVVCLQSPLVIDNRRPNWLSRSFAVEYAALFDALLPVLARWRMPLPLGGTSNHFRHAALTKAGGWDPFNVTEDADLGVRLSRLGYRCATLELPTLEDAPTGLRTWRRQRTRWFKGWMQTWLVHMRHPIRLARELGPAGFLGFNLVSTGLIVSSLVYPLYFLLLLTALANPLHFWGDGGLLAASLFGLNLFNLGAAYIAMGLLGHRALKLRGRSEAGAICLLPIYWLIASFASYRAVFQLLTKPFVWEKTPHRPHG
jgi:glycosyltransferase XagB